MQWDRKTDEGSIGLMPTRSGCVVTTWTKTGRTQGSMPLTLDDARALKELLVVYESYRAELPNGKAVSDE